MNRPTHDGPHLRIMTNNIEYLHQPRELAAALDEFEPDLVHIQQANPAVRYLYDIPKYRLRRVGDSAEAHDLAMLVRHGHRVTKQEPILVPGSEWTGPIEGRHHTEKVFHAALIDDLAWDLNIHVPTKRPESNEHARHQCFERLAAFAENHPHRPLIMAGDWNTPAQELRDWAESIGAKVAGVGIDVFVYRGARLLDVTKPDDIARPDGTHGWVYADFELLVEPQ